MGKSLENFSDKESYASGMFQNFVHPILTRYVLKEFWRLFGLALSGLLCISILVEFFEKVSDFIEHHAALWMIIEYFIFFIPKVIFYGAPMAVLLATLLTIGIFSRNSELIAMRAAGISLYSISVPLLLVALFVSILSFAFNESLVFSANQKLNYIKDVKINKKPQKAFYKQNKVWMRGKDNTIINIEVLQPEGEQMYGVTVYRFDENFSLIERVDAQEVRWDGERWIFINGKTMTFPADGKINEKEFDAIYYNLKEKPENLREVEKKSEEMNIFELYRYIQKLKYSGYGATRHIVDMHAKVSYAFMSFIMAMFGVPFSVRGKRSEGIIIGIGMSILIAVVYWIIFAMGISFGRAGVFPPFFAAWIGNLLFGASGLYMLLSVRQ